MQFTSGRLFHSFTDFHPRSQQQRSRSALTGASRPSRPEEPGRRIGLQVVWLSLTFLLLSLNLRPSITSLPPLFTYLARGFRLPGNELTALAAIPVLSFAIASLSLPYLHRWFSARCLVIAALIALGLSQGLRGILIGWIVPFTAVGALAIGIIGALIPGIIKQYKPTWSGPLLTAYLIGLYGGAMAGSAASVPIYTWSRGSLALTMGVWGIAVLFAIPACLNRLPQPPPTEQDMSRSSIHALVKLKMTWFVIIFMAAQSLIYYATLTWLPTLLQARGESAGSSGFAAASLNIGGLIAAWTIPVLAGRFAGQRLLVCMVVLVTIAGLLGLAFLPLSTAVGWSIVLGAGQGGAIGLALYFTVARATTPSVSTTLSSLSQGIGYLIATSGPPLMEWWHQITSSWPVTFALLTIVSMIELGIGLLAASPRQIGE